MTNIKVTWDQTGRQFSGFGPDSATVKLDGGNVTGPSPMMILLHANAACSAIDVLNILEKMKQMVESLSVEVEGVRAEGDYPRVWEKINMAFSLTGELDPKKVERAIQLSVEKYCSVGAMLEKSAEITSSFVINKA